jgi:mannosyl-oligosaccharide alpha-1,2-mannosidase
MWPAMVSTANYNVSVYLSSTSPNDQYTLGALADSTYEYLPKEYILLGGLAPQYKTMYENFIPVAKKNLFFRPMTLDNRDILISGTLTVSNGGSSQFVPDLQHLTCFSGGFLALAGKIFDRPEDVEDGIRLTNGCVWAYQNTITGIMPESFLAVPCENSIDCTWDEKTWWDAVDPFSGSEEEARQIILKNRLSPGFVRTNVSLSHPPFYLCSIYSPAPRVTLETSLMGYY